MLASCVLRVAPSRLPKLLEFYERCLGMQIQRHDDFVELLVPKQSCSLRLVSEDQVKVGYRHKGTDIYWKIGLAIDDVQSASERLGCAPGSQFLDIGFLTHLADPAGFTIELLQTTFEANAAERATRLARPVENSASLMAQDFVIGQITTRITDPKPSLEFYQKVLRMKLMSVQPVTPYRFTLYFLAYTEEDPPNADLEAVENREWLWQRPYTTLELQHRWDSAPASLSIPRSDEEGLHGITIQIPSEHLQALEREAPGYVVRVPGRSGSLLDPDGLPLEVEVAG